MNSKYLFLLLLGVSVLGAWFVYGDGVSFSTSDAAGYAVNFTHVEGTQSLSIGETVRISWPREYSDADISLVANFGSSHDPYEETYKLGHSSRNKFTWEVWDESIPGGLPRNALLSFMVSKGENRIYSTSFAVVDWLGTDSSTESAQILALQNQISILQEELVEKQSIIDGLLAQIATLQQQLINLTQ